MGMFLILRVVPVYRIRGIMDQFEYIKTLMEVMLPYAEEEMPLSVSTRQRPQTHREQHLGSRPARLMLWINVMLLMLMQRNCGL